MHPHAPNPTHPPTHPPARPPPNPVRYQHLKTDFNEGFGEDLFWI